MSLKFNWFFDKHFGIGLRWDNWLYPLHISIAFPFVTVTIGLGKIKQVGSGSPLMVEELGDCFGLQE